MADRTSAEIFGLVFEHLAENPDERNKEFAAKMYAKTSGYDFSDYQMYCDDALIKLGLARRGVDPRYPEDGEVLLYGPEEGATK